jgi:hypothetical protein
MVLGQLFAWQQAVKTAMLQRYIPRVDLNENLRLDHALEFQGCCAFQR